MDVCSHTSEDVMGSIVSPPGMRQASGDGRWIEIPVCIDQACIDAAKVRAMRHSGVTDTEYVAGHVESDPVLDEYARLNEYLMWA